MRNIPHQTAATVLICLAMLGAAFAGPLTPPGGPVASTYKTLAEVEPRVALSATNTPGDATCVFKVTQAGSYYLTGNINVPAGKTGIVIAASQVTVDLNGFTISGGATGISSNSLTSQISVRNGNVTNLTLHAVDLSNSSNAAVDHVTVQNVLGTGIGTGSTSHISDCRVAGGANAYSFGFASLVERCLSTSASGNGFYGTSQCRLIDCTAQLSGNTGFQTFGANDHYTRCTADQCGARGFEIGTYSLVESCIASTNSGIGFNAGTGSTIRGCLAEFNSAQGIVGNGGVTIVGNQIRYGPSGIAAIWLQGTQCRADGNEITAYGYGVFTTTTSHVIVRNSVTGASTKAFQIGTGNLVGTIVAPSATSSVISGSSGGAAFSADPNANIVY